MSAEVLSSVGAIIGGLVGAVILLLRFLVASKDAQIKTLEDELRDTRAERDLFRSLTLTRRDD